MRVSTGQVPWAFGFAGLGIFPPLAQNAAELARHLRDVSESSLTAVPAPALCVDRVGVPEEQTFRALRSRGRAVH